ncbi:hypothetical protein [Aquimarina algiphila]|uniref:Uncharacterized protein n=1 Tax=Aquimarina algiphila TaxID=2047982 RepID=A0A554VPE1_9FLAO|nr:hypothetical protein [Aquimarina algiphila]TSE10337.1 hypothetical protein FOF46_04700 [Aquimarina algiphila]
MKSNDSLLYQMIATDQKQHHKLPKLITDERIYAPETIKVGVNEVVYLHYFRSNVYNFCIQVHTPTEILTLDRKNTQYNASNTILRSVSDIKFKSEARADFYVQLLRIQY